MLDTMLPSEETRKKWVYAYWDAAPALAEGDNYQGRWYIRRPLSGLDAIWVAVREACQNGRLGRSVKCTTSLLTAENRYSGKAMLHVDTDDWRDDCDVWRVEQALRRLGLRGDIYYEPTGGTARGFARLLRYRSFDRGNGAYERQRIATPGVTKDNYEGVDSTTALPRVRLGPVYYAPPLWSLDQGFAIPLTMLPMPEMIRERLQRWSHSYDNMCERTRGEVSTLPASEETRAFEREGISLWEQLRQEWKGQCNVLYYSEERGRLFEDPEEYQSQAGG